MPEFWQLFWTTGLLLTSVAFLIYTIVGINKGVDWHSSLIKLTLAVLCLIFSAGAERGGGIYAHTFYSKEVRAVWVANLALQEKLTKGTAYMRMSLACPKKEMWSTWDETTRKMWLDSQLKDGRKPYLEGCYIRAY